MRTGARTLLIAGSAVLLMLGGANVGHLSGKEKTPQISPDDPTLRLYNLLDSKFNGKLSDFILLADVANDPKNPGQPQQHILSVEYNKDRSFGKLIIHVRTVAQLTPEQLKTYTPKQIYDFAETDSGKFTKTDPGPFGRPGDVYVEPTAEGGAMGTVAVTPEVQAQYELFVTRYIQSALEKKAAEANGS
jgi:hypothetical protein